MILVFLFFFLSIGTVNSLLRPIIFPFIEEHSILIKVGFVFGLTLRIDWFQEPVWMTAKRLLLPVATFVPDDGARLGFRLAHLLLQLEISDSLMESSDLFKISDSLSEPFDLFKILDSLSESFDLNNITWITVSDLVASVSGSTITV
ncbi:hypothetical protein HanRHA438_Chr17g0811171 [Helianthus annuus]|nr:hypothetical protein HanRHA438_Chr17g0811171 [Helianthus annuus]